MVATTLVLLILAPPVAMTEGQVLDQVKKAYTSVKTLSVSAKLDHPQFEAKCDIRFQAPGNLRVTGSALGGQPFDLLAIASKTWLKTSGKWDPQESPEMGIASITGISGGTGALVPALLMKVDWGSIVLKKGAAPASPSDYKGTSVYVIHGLHNRIWVDAKTFFILRDRTEHSGLVMDVMYGETVKDKPIPASTFVRK